MELTTIAKPYAKAINDIAVAAGNFDSWKNTLDILAIISKDSVASDFIYSPKSNNADRVKFISSTLGAALGRDTTSEENNFVKLLIVNNRMKVSSSIAELFNSFATNTIKKISIISAYDLSESEKSQIAEILKKKYNCEIVLNIAIDASLVGGVVVKDGDKVIDLSVNAGVEKLAACLAKN